MSARVAAIVLVFALAGCTLGPNFKVPFLNLPRSFPEPAAETKDSLAVPANWWRLYGDATLDELVAAGLERNADVELAAARIEEAEAVLRESNATFLPEIDANAAAGRSRSSTRTGTLPPTAQATRNNFLLVGEYVLRARFLGPPEKDQGSRARAVSRLALRGRRRRAHARCGHYANLLHCSLARRPDHRFRGNAPGRRRLARHRPQARAGRRGVRPRRQSGGLDPRADRSADQGFAPPARSRGASARRAHRCARSRPSAGRLARASDAAAAAGRPAFDAARAQARRAPGRSSCSLRRPRRSAPRRRRSFRRSV